MVLHVPRGLTTPPEFERRWRSRFEDFGAQGDDDASIAGWSSTGLNARRRNFARLWQPGPRGALWLDVGCGAGTYTRFLTNGGAVAIGMDYSLPTLLKARSRSPGLDAWCLGDVNRLPVRSESLDGVLCFGVLQALERSDRALDELVRVVRPGGEVWVDALNALSLSSLLESAIRRIRRTSLHLRFESARRLREMMSDAGLENVGTYWVPIAPSSVQALQPILESPAVRAMISSVPGLGALVSHAVVLCGTRQGRSG
jgi:SAM-dependent methyltransferase